jgi:hypothetical protein
MKVSTEIDNNFGYEKITQLVDNIPLSCEFEFWFSPDTLVSATNKTDLHDITEILLKVAFNTITLILTVFSFFIRLLR